MIKFPKTPRFKDIKQDIYKDWKILDAVISEKIDGANTGIFFDKNKGMLLQSRGHILRGGSSETQFSHFHPWAWAKESSLKKALGYKYLLYGEYCLAKHRAFYDNLPDIFIGFDILDIDSNQFLNTKLKNPILTAAGIVNVPVLWSGKFKKAENFNSYIGPSKFKTNKWRDALKKEVDIVGRNYQDVIKETDDSDLMEGIYIRIEDEEKVVARIKLHREEFEKVRNDDWRINDIIKNVVKGSK